MMRKVKRLIPPFFNSEHPSFLDVLRDSTPRRYPSDNEPVHTTNNDIAEPWQNADVDDLDLAGIGDGQDIDIEDHVTLGVEELQAEANNMLNPEWTLRLDDIPMTRNAEASVGTGHFHPGILDAIAQGQDIGWEQQASASQQAGDTYSAYAGPEHTDMANFMLTSLQDVTAQSQAQRESTQPLETVRESACLNTTKAVCSLPNDIPEVVPKRASKRKRMTALLRKKKPRLTPSQEICNDGSNAPKNDMSSRLISRTDLAKNPNTHGIISSKHPPSNDLSEYPRVNRMPAWERGPNELTHFDDAGIVRDIRISESERRPLSWPHRNPWRKSLDISVAVLTKGFEKLMMEKGESAPLAS